MLEGWHGTNDQRANARLRNLGSWQVSRIASEPPPGSSFSQRQRPGLRLLRHDGDMDRYQGGGIRRDLPDEATQLKEEWLRQFAACVRGVNDFPKRVYYTCNPGGPGHGYIKRLFIDRR